MKVVTAAQMQALDRETIQGVGIPGVVLMENAGREAAKLILEHFPDASSKGVAVLAGRGNNGGDGFVIARYLRGQGKRTKVYLFAPREKVGGDARVNLEVWLRIGGELEEITSEEGFQRIKGEIAEAGLIVDALLGTGLRSEVRGLLREAIEFVNGLKKPVVAVDIPSGLDASTGKVLGTAIRASLTPTFGLAKLGQVISPGAELVGRLEVIDIGIPPSLVEKTEIKTHLLGPEELSPRIFASRPPESHKGTYGHLLVVAGSPGKTGAAAMVAEGALRMGAGLVTVAIPQSLNPILEVKLTEAMTEPVPEEEGFLCSDSLPSLLSLLEGKSAIALGPGIGTGEGVKEVILEFLRKANLPLVIDADGLNVLSSHPQTLREIKVPFILTPHPGEMARLVGLGTAEVQERRIEVAREVAGEYRCVVVLKGNRTVVASPEGEIFINPTGNPGMASGGMGDVLTGMIGGLLAQGHPPLEAAKAAVYLHGLSGDLGARELGELPLLATDLLEFLPLALKEVTSGVGAHLPLEES